jgi:hypothetical protein
MTQEHDVDPTALAENGHAPPPALNGKRPSTSQLLVGSEGDGYFDLPKELLQGSGDFSVLLAKARFDKQEGAAILRMLVDEDQYEDGSIDARQMVYLKAMVSICEDGKAREEARLAYTGGQGFRAGLGGMMRGFGFGVGNQQTNGTAQRDGPN